MSADPYGEAKLLLRNMAHDRQAIIRLAQANAAGLRRRVHDGRALVAILGLNAREITDPESGLAVYAVPMDDVEALLEWARVKMPRTKGGEPSHPAG